MSLGARSTLVATAALAIVLTGCHVRGAAAIDEPMKGRVITAAEIKKLGARDAWEVVKRTGAYSTQETHQGEPQRIWRRGRGSIVIQEAPLVVIDGIATEDFRALRQVDARYIDHMRLLSAVEGTHFFGAPGGSGAILVHTKRSLDAD